MKNEAKQPAKRDSFGSSFGALVALAGLNYISSRGLRVILALAQSIMPTGGRLTVVNTTPFVRQVFDISGFSTLFVVQ